MKKDIKKIVATVMILALLSGQTVLGAEMNTDTQVPLGETTEEGHPAGENVGEETQIPKTEDNNTEVGKTQENIPEEEADNLSEI